MPLMNEASALYVGPQAVSRVYRGTSLVWQPDSGGGATPPAWGGFATNGQSGNPTTMTVDAPSGVAAGDYQLVVIGIASSSPDFGTVPSGWTQIVNVPIDYPNTASSGRVGVFESTSATGTFTIPVVNQGRVYQAARVFYRGHSGRSLAPAVTADDNLSSTSHPLPAVNAPAGSIVIGIGVSEYPNGGAGWGFNGFGSFTQRVDLGANNSIESLGIGIADLAVPTAQNGVTTNFTLQDATDATMISIVLNGV